MKASELKPKVVLGVAAHPDDLDFGAAGTMAIFAKNGADIHYLVVTDGCKGSDDPTMTSEELTTLRETEQQEALKILGGKNITFLRYPDSSLEVTMQLKKDIVRAIRTLKPDVVVTMDPSVLFSAERGLINHPDHRAAGQATLDAVFPLARDHLTFPDLNTDDCQPHKTPTVLLINLDSGNFYVDITNTFDTKIESLKAHASQIHDMDNTISWMRSFAAECGQNAGYELAECFVRIDIA